MTAGLHSLCSSLSICFFLCYSPATFQRTRLALSQHLLSIFVYSSVCEQRAGSMMAVGSVSLAIHGEHGVPRADALLRIITYNAACSWCCCLYTAAPRAAAPPPLLRRRLLRRAAPPCRVLCRRCLLRGSGG